MVSMCGIVLMYFVDMLWLCVFGIGMLLGDCWK